MAEKVKKTKKEKKVVNPTEGQTSVQESAEEMAPVQKKTKKKVSEPKDSGKVAATGQAAKADATLESGASVASPAPKPVPGNSKSPEEVKPEAQQKASPSHEEVARLAYHFWKERGGHHGSHQQDWFRAEQELRGTAS